MDVCFQLVSIAKGNTVIIRDTPVPDVRMWHVKNAELCTALLTRSTVARVRVLRTRIIHFCIASTAKRSINRPKRITADACIRPVSTAERNTAITWGTPVPDVLMKRVGNAMLCTARSTAHITVRERRF